MQKFFCTRSSNVYANRQPSFALRFHFEQSIVIRQKSWRVSRVSLISSREWLFEKNLLSTGKVSTLVCNRTGGGQSQSIRLFRNIHSVWILCTYFSRFRKVGPYIFFPPTPCLRWTNFDLGLLVSHKLFSFRYFPFAEIDSQLLSRFSPNALGGGGVPPTENSKNLFDPAKDPPTPLRGVGDD